MALFHFKWHILHISSCVCYLDFSVHAPSQTVRTAPDMPPPLSASGFSQLHTQHSVCVCVHLPVCNLIGREEDERGTQRTHVVVAIERNSTLVFLFFYVSLLRGFLFQFCSLLVFELRRPFGRSFSFCVLSGWRLRLPSTSLSRVLLFNAACFIIDFSFSCYSIRST